MNYLVSYHFTLKGGRTHGFGHIDVHIPGGIRTYQQVMDVESTIRKDSDDDYDAVVIMSWNRYEVEP